MRHFILVIWTFFFLSAAAKVDETPATLLPTFLYEGAMGFWLTGEISREGLVFFQHRLKQGYAVASVVSRLSSIKCAKGCEYRLEKSEVFFFDKASQKVVPAKGAFAKVATETIVPLYYPWNTDEKVRRGLPSQGGILRRLNFKFFRR